MSDFKIFIKHVEDGNLKDVVSNFQLNFLEKSDNWEKGKPIHYACSNGHLEIVKFLLQNKCNIECEDINKSRPIHYACSNGHLEIVKFLLQNKCSIECETLIKWKPIHYACFKGHLKIVKFLLQNKCNIECDDNEKWQPIHYACYNGHLEIVIFLIQNKCSIECENNEMWRPIHYACYNGHPKIVKFLVQNKCNIECENKNKEQPIHLACMNGSQEIVKFLLQKKCSIECENNEKKRPIHYACLNGHIEIVKFLFQNKCNMECEDNEKRRPIHLACKTGHLEVVKFLQQKKYSIECEDNEKWRPIHLVCMNGYLEIVKFLLQNKCSIECETSIKSRPIHYACSKGQLEIVKFLLQNKCNIECENDEKWRPIHYACYNGHLEIVKVLLQNKCSIECETSIKYRPIHYACLNGHPEIVKYLLQSRCKLDCLTAKGQTPLDIAIEMDYQCCARILSDFLERRKIFDCVRRDDVHLIDALYNPTILTMEEEETSLSLLEVALQSEANKIIDYFLNKNVNAEEILPIKNYIESCSRPDAVKLILECLLYRSIRFHDADGFHLSCLAKTINEHEKLISFLEIAAEYGCSAFIDIILKKSIYNEEAWTRANDLAILKGYDEIAEAISNRKFLLKIRADKNFNLLHSAVCDNDPDMIKYILDRNLINPNSNNEVVGTCLALAYMLCHVKCIEILQQYNVEVDTQNIYCQSPLHEALSSGMTGHCSYLISRAQYIDKPGFMGLTALQCAVIEGCENLCNELLKNGADCIRYVENFQQSYFKETVLPISTHENAVTLCMKIHETIYPCFLKVLNSNKVNCSDGNENTLLHIAVKALAPDLCKILINCGANVGAINIQGNSPLFELFSRFDHELNIDKTIKTFNILINSGADINKKSHSGVTVFQCASQCKSERLMLDVLSKHPDLEIVTESDFKLAFTNGWFTYAKALIQLMPEDSIKSFISTEIFHLSMSHARPKLLKSLFLKARNDVQQSIIENLLKYFAENDKYDAFIKLLETKIIEPKLFSNGETMFTSLLKDKNVKYCWTIINHRSNRKYLNLANVLNQIPLHVAIEAELYDLICPLIFGSNQLNNIDNKNNTPLMQLFQKLSISTDIITDHKLMTAVQAIISRGGDIYKENFSGIKMIESCSRLPLRIEIEAFQNMERNKDTKMIGERFGENICNICFDRKLDCVFECGHTFCTSCGMKLSRCPMCNAEPTNPKRFFIN